MINFTTKHCVPCEGGVEPLAPAKVQEYLSAVTGWEVLADNKKIWREIIFKDFVTAISFINKVATLAESEGHHPDLHLTSWNHLKVELWTHAIGGLSDNDFILAAKINSLNQTLDDGGKKV